MFKTGFYISVLTIVIAMLVQVFVNVTSNGLHYADNVTNHDFYLFVLVSPALESMLSIFFLGLCSAFISQYSSCIALGFVWAMLHATMGSEVSIYIGLWLVSFISFSLYGLFYFRYRYSKFQINVLLITFPHSLHNLYVYLLLS
ncbi:hypothetical protein NM22_11360 [Vibrio tubiashii]|nr:hypothetical protein NM22_11360 [Vibrio tubiashii]